MAQGPVAPDASGNVTLHVSADGTASKRADGADFQYLSTAIEKAQEGDTIIIDNDISAPNNNAVQHSAYGIYVIDKDLTIEGAGSGITITATGDNKITDGSDHDDVHMFQISSGDVTIENITINGQYTDGSSYYVRHGIQAYGSGADLTLNNVTVNNCFGYGVVVNNGATVDATNLNAKGNGWGGVNVQDSTVVIKGSNTDLTSNGATTDEASKTADVASASVVIESGSGKTTSTTIENGKFDAVYTHNRTNASDGTDTLTITGGKFGSVAVYGSGNDSVSIEGAEITNLCKNNNLAKVVVESSKIGGIVSTTVAGQNGESVTVDESGITFISSSVSGTDTNTVAAKIGDTTYESVAAAINAVSTLTGPVTIDVYQNEEIRNANLSFTKNVTINGNGHEILITPTSGKEDVAITINNCTLTLNDVNLEVSGYSAAGDNNGTAFSLKGSNTELKLTGGTVLDINTLNKGLILPEKEGKITVTDASNVKISTIDGNASNGGTWYFSNSELYVDGCGDYGISAYAFETIGDSTIEIKNTGLGAIYAQTKINIGADSKVTVIGCGSKLPHEKTWGNCYAPIQLVTGKDGWTTHGSITIADGATVTISQTGSKATADIYVPNNTTFSSGKISASVKLEETENPSKVLVTYKDTDGSIIASQTQNKGDTITVPNQGITNLDHWTVEGEPVIVGSSYELTADVEFIAVYKAAPTYTIRTSATGGTVSYSPNAPTAGQTVTLTLSASNGYTATGATVTVKNDATSETVGVSGSGATRTFTMPASDVTVTVTFKATSTPGGDDDDKPETPTTYTVTPSYNSYGTLRINGYSAGSVASVTPGTSVTVTVSPTTGYRVDSVTYRYNGANYSATQTGTYTFSFIMPAGNVTVSANIVPSNAYPLNISSVSHGSIKLYDEDDDRIYDEDLVPYGETVTIEVTPAEGYILKSITVEDSDRDDIEVEKVRENVYRFDMPRDEVTLYTEFTPGYEIIIDDDIRYGEITTDPEDYAAEDDTVEVYFKPSNGYKLKTIEVFTGKDFDDEVTVRLHSSGDYYRFTMPDGDVYITAEFERTTMPFTDVRTTDWYYDEVLYVYNNGLMEGVSSYSFNPSGTMTREMFWAVLGRIDGQSITGTNWASQARSWAMNEGVSDGTNPTSLITREEMVTMLWRYAGSRAASGGLSRFNDASTISSWASTAMSWAVNNGIIDGVTSNTIQPRGTADRAQCAAIFMRYDQM